MIDRLRRVVFFGAHTDDEMICAGTLHRLVRGGVEVHVVTFAPAATKEDRTGTEQSVKVVLPEWHRALSVIGVPESRRLFLGMTPSADLHPRRQMICQWIYDYVEKHRPDAVFGLSPEDENTAHAIVGVETERVTRGRVPVTVRCHFPWNFGLGRPNLYVQLEAEDQVAKVMVINAYQSQHFRYNYQEMLVGYARADGLSVKAEAAERFEVVRAVV